MNFSKKNAQVGIFVVIGVILIVGFIFLVSLNFDNVPVFNDEKTTHNVKEFVESCLEVETSFAMDKIGATGGWIYSKPIIFTNRNTNDEVNKLAEGINFLEKNELPYWYFYDDSDEEFKINIPTYDLDDDTYSIKSQMERYLKENLENNCLQGFEVFKDKFDIKYDFNDIDTELIFLEDEIVANLRLELEITDLNSQEIQSLESFRSSVDNKIYLPYNLAKEIVKAENNLSFVEVRVMNILRAYQDSGSRDLLPPQDDMELTFDFEPWRILEVKELAKLILSSEISRVQFLNTDYEVSELPDELKDNEFAVATSSIYVKDYISESSSLDENNPQLFEKFKSLKVNPTYEPFFPMYFKIKQALGNSILLPRPQMLAGFIPFPFTEYAASYEIVAPVIFEISSSQRNDNFVFNLPIEINIKHNTPLKNNYELDFEIENLPKATKSLICDESQFVSGYYTINITDPIFYGQREILSPKKGVEDAIVEFTCKELANCYIGKTQALGDELVPEENRETSTDLRFRLPLNCEPGTLKITKFGHKTLEINNLNPTLDNSVDLGSFEMPSSKVLNVRAGIKKAGAGTAASVKSIKDYQDGFMIFENLEEETFVRVLEINSENQYNLSLELMPGEYKITGVLTHNNEVKIPEEEICYKTGIFSGKDCEQIPGTNLSSWLAGGYDLTVNITTEDILKYDYMDISFVEYEIPINYDGLEKVGDDMARVSTYSSKPYFYNK